jgi:hypothetical protein
VAIGGELQDDTNKSNQGRQHERWLSSPLIGNGIAAESSDEAAGLERADDVGREIGESDLVQSFKAEFSMKQYKQKKPPGISGLGLLIELRQGQYTTDDPDIHTEEHTTKTGLQDQRVLEKGS